jgi:hypothetical protein
MFWVDLTTANGLNLNLIDGSFSVADPRIRPGSTIPTTGISAYMPAAKIGRGNYIYVYSGGYTYNGGSAVSDARNYFGLSIPSSMLSPGQLASDPGLTVAEAYNIDKKVDDGYPQSGNITAMFIDDHGTNSPDVEWAGGGGTYGASGAGNIPTTTATSGSVSTCYDNGHAAGAAQQYSLSQANGGYVNCALSFKLQ